MTATGIVEDLNNGTNLNCTINECNYGLYYDYQVKETRQKNATIFLIQIKY